MPRKCSTFGCSATSKKNIPSTSTTRSVHFFNIPKQPELRQKWEQVLLPKGEVFHDRSIICDEHFAPEDIVKSWTYYIQGKTIEIERDRWTLRENAVPIKTTCNVDIEAYPNNNEAVQSEPSHDTHGCFQASVTEQLLNDEELRGWTLYNIDDNTFAVCKLSLSNSVIFVDKAVIVHRREGAVINCAGKVVAPRSIPCATQVNNTSSLVAVLKSLQKLKSCKGYTTTKTASMPQVNSKKCTILSRIAVCIWCNREKRRVQMPNLQACLKAPLKTAKVLARNLSRTYAAKRYCMRGMS